MDSSSTIAAWKMLDTLAAAPLWTWAVALAIAGIGSAVSILILLVLFTPSPRLPRPSEKQFISILPDGSVSRPQQLPCWFDTYRATRKATSSKGKDNDEVEKAECFMSVVVPAYNEELRLSEMLEEAVGFLHETYGQESSEKGQTSNGKPRPSDARGSRRKGWEVLIVSDGSTDRTVDVALDFARKHQLGGSSKSGSNGQPGGSAQGNSARGIPPGSIRVVKLEENRGKGGAVTHGMRHVRGEYVVFADADGASKFTDLGKLVEGCERVKDWRGRAVGVGSRAHMVGTEAVVKRSLLRNTLMRAFHLLIRTLTPAKTGRIKDTQCGFKLFTRSSLPYIVPYMHSEGWIFDVEMLMLAESADIPMVEVPVGWKEVMGSKLNVVKDSLGMAIGLAVLRVGWGLGIYRRD